jgi:hypothetical protein
VGGGAAAAAVAVAVGACGGSSGATVASAPSRAALLTVRDLPAGFGPPREQEVVRRNGLCGQRPVDSVIRARGQQEAVFFRRPGGPLLRETIDTFAGQDATRYMAAVRAQARCKSAFEVRGESGRMTKVSLSLPRFARLGDETFAFQFTNLADGTYTADYALIRRGRSIIEVSLGAPPNPPLWRQIAHRAYAKAAAKQTS